MRQLLLQPDIYKDKIFYQGMVTTKPGKPKQQSSASHQTQVFIDKEFPTLKVQENV